jgi:FAD binding domain
LRSVNASVRLVLELKTFSQIKAGGRATNPGFSSTPGIQIALSKFKDVTYDSKLHTATVGAGLTWAELYTKLQPLGVTVVGGRIVGVGMSGVTLGGGEHILYSCNTFLARTGSLYSSHQVIRTSLIDTDW